MAGEFYHDGQRRLQDHFDSRRIADRLEEVTLHDAFHDGDREFIETSTQFFLATVDADGFPDCSYKGGDPGFVKLVDEKTLAFPSFDGNGQFRSLGNILRDPRVALLFVNFEDPDRLRVHGLATLDTEDPLKGEWPGAQLVVRVKATRIFPNCPRYVHKMTLVEPSPFVPRGRKEPPVPGWKRAPVFSDALPVKPPERARLRSG